MFLVFITLYIIPLRKVINQSGKYDCDKEISIPSVQNDLINCLKNDSHIKVNEGTINVSLVPSGQGSERVIKVFEFQSSHKEVNLSYIIKFDNEFDFARGGKLTGLSSYRVVSGGMERKVDSGWSVRVVFGKSGSLGVYYYLHKDIQKFGNFKFFENFKFSNDVEYKIKLRVRINSIGQQNGLICLSVDENESFCIERLEFCSLNCDYSYIEKFLFSVFHGGNDSSYSPRDFFGNPKAVSVDFREIKIF